MSSGAPSQSGGGDNLVAGIILTLAVLLAGWAVARQYVVSGALWVLRAEAAVVAPFVDVLGSDRQRVDLQRWRSQLASAPPIMPASRLMKGVTSGGRWIRWPIAIALVALAIWVVRRSPVIRYSRTMTFETLLLEQQLSFPRIRPVLWLKNRPLDKDRGAFTWALSPYELARRHGAIQAHPDPAQVERSWDEAAAARMFTQQLGPTLDMASRSSLDSVPYHARILLAAFVARVLDARADSDRILDAASAGFQPLGWSRRGRIARWWAAYRGREWDWPAQTAYEIAMTPDVHALVERYVASLKQRNRATLVLEAHAYLSTGMVSLLRAARDRQGALTSADFIWLKAVDRTLHYALNDVGRRVASAEASGVRAHWMHEIDSGAPVVVPHIGEAVIALSKHLQESGWQPPPAVREAELSGAATV